MAQWESGRIVTSQSEINDPSIPCLVVNGDWHNGVYIEKALLVRQLRQVSTADRVWFLPGRSLNRHMALCWVAVHVLLHNVPWATSSHALLCALISYNLRGIVRVKHVRHRQRNFGVVRFSSIRLATEAVYLSGSLMIGQHPIYIHWDHFALF
ncbi:TPA: hypothetical protein ACH3X1_000032 [Trebouxia sp. C0004]